MRIDLSTAIGVELMNDCQIMFKQQPAELCSSNIADKISLGRIDLGDSYAIHFKLHLSDDFLIGANVLLHIIAEYTSAAPSKFISNFLKYKFTLICLFVAVLQF